METGKRARESGDGPADMPDVTTASEVEVEVGVNEARKVLKVLALGTHMTLTDEQAHFLAQVSPYVANAASADAEDATGGPSRGWARASGASGASGAGGASGASGLALDVSPRFVEKTITLARAFCEWERLDDGAGAEGLPEGLPDGLPAKAHGTEGPAPAPAPAPKQIKRALVSAMIRDLTACPFDAHYVAVLEMTEKLDSMLGALGAAQGLSRDLDRDQDLDLDTDIARHFGKLPPTQTEPHQSARALVLARAMVRAARRYNANASTTTAGPASGLGVLIEVEHWEIDANSTHVYGPDGSTRILCGRHSPNGCAIQAVTLMCGLTARAHIELSRTRHSQSKLVMTDTTVGDFVASVSKAWTRLTVTTGREEDRAAASLARFLALIPALLIDLY